MNKNPKKSLEQILRQAAREFREAGGPTPRLDAELLLCHILNLKRTDLIIRSNEPMDINVERHFKSLCERRLAGEPLAYIRGSQEFYGRTFLVNSDTLIPRPDTELLVEIAKGLGPFDRPATIIDIGSGSGNLAITLDLEIANSIVAGWDISEGAIAMAERNAKQLNSTARFFKKDALNSSSWENGDMVDIIVSNPPYIDSKDPLIQASVRDYEPATALFAGEQGLVFYKTISKFCRKKLKVGGKLIFEIGFRQGDAVTQILRNQGLAAIEVKKDLSGHDRVVIAELI